MLSVRKQNYFETKLFFPSKYLYFHFFFFYWATTPYDFFSTDGSYTVLAFKVHGTFLLAEMEYSTVDMIENAGLQLSNLTVNDSGYYSVNVLAAGSNHADTQTVHISVLGKSDVTMQRIDFFVYILFYIFQFDFLSVTSRIR